MAFSSNCNILIEDDHTLHQGWVTTVILLVLYLKLYLVILVLGEGNALEVEIRVGRGIGFSRTKGGEFWEPSCWWSHSINWSWFSHHSGGMV